MGQALTEVTKKPLREVRPASSPWSEAIAKQNALGHWRLDDMGLGDAKNAAQLRNEVTHGAPLLCEGTLAFYLPGAGSGHGWGSSEVLRESKFSAPKGINRAVQLADGFLRVPSGKVKSLAFWFWLGHRSGASAREGALAEAFGTLITATQDTNHHVVVKVGETMSTAPLKADDWHFMVINDEGNALRIFIDGSESFKTPKGNLQQPEIRIGNGLQGKIDELSTHAEPLQAEAVSTLWKLSGVAEDHAASVPPSPPGISKTPAFAPEAASVITKLKPTYAEPATTTIGRRIATASKSAGDWGAAFWFRNDLHATERPVTAYLASRGPDGDHTCPGDHLGIGGSFRNDVTGRLIVFNGNQADGLLIGRTPLKQGAWHHVVLSRNGNKMTVWLDGNNAPEIEGELQLTAANDTPEPVFLGARTDNLALMQDALNAWRLREGYEIQLVVAEPLVLDPVAFDWDDQEGLWVVEMADSPLGMDGKGKAGGRVVRLTDSNNDGAFDERKVIAQNLNLPTGIITWRDGVIVTAAPDVLFIHQDGTIKPLLSGFSTGNQQLRVNGLCWGMDGWIYGAAGAHLGFIPQLRRSESRIWSPRSEESRLTSLL